MNQKFTLLRPLLTIALFLILIKPALHAQQTSKKTLDPQEWATIKTDRKDNRFLSSRGIVYNLLNSTPPKYAFNPNFLPSQLREWQKKVRESMKKIMQFPKTDNSQPLPKKIEEQKRDGYTLQKWEAYPLPSSVITYLVLIPDNFNKRHPVPAVLCIPGSGETKESLAGEEEINPGFKHSRFYQKNEMALQYVKMGLVAVAVDDPAAGEASDLEKVTGNSDYDYVSVSRGLLELGWSYLGYTSFMDMQVLNWMKTRPYIDRSKIIVAGFSLGTEPLMVLGVLDTSIYAFVYNDFLCRTRERALVVTKPDSTGYRPVPNTIRHLVPNFWRYFDFPDLVCAFAPRPVIFTEGGMDRDFDLVKKAYKIVRKEDNVQVYEYPKFNDPKSRSMLRKLPTGIDASTYFKLVNVDPPMHYFKEELVLPWIKKILQQTN